MEIFRAKLPHSALKCLSANLVALVQPLLCLPCFIMVVTFGKEGGGSMTTTGGRVMGGCGVDMGAAVLGMGVVTRAMLGDCTMDAVCVEGGR